MSRSLLERARRYLRERRGRAGREAATVLYYHGIVEHKLDRRLERNFTSIEGFRHHLRLLRSRRVLSVAELAASTEEPARGARPGVVITFDDGYRNNLLAAELLDEARLPWTVFLVAGAVGGGETIWTAELSLLLLQGRATTVEAVGRPWSLETRAAREKAFQQIRTRMKRMSSEERRQTLASLRDQFPPGESERLLAEFPSFRMLSWDDAAELARAGVELGSHGMHHEIHHPAQPAEVRRRELRESRELIAGTLGRPCRFFAFPNGDFVETSGREIVEAGYALAFGTEEGAVTTEASAHVVPRMDGNRSWRALAGRL